MDDEKKPFECKMGDCMKSFTNEDHLNVHRKKHDLNLILELSGAKSGNSAGNFNRMSMNLSKKIVLNCYLL